MTHKTTAVVSTKGGGTKTTTSINKATWLAKYQGAKVLMIDCDPMQSLSLYTGDYTPAKNGLTHVVRKQNFDDAITSLPFEGVDFVYNDDPNNDLDQLLRERIDGGFILKKALNRLSEYGDYDYVVLDTTPHRCKLLEMCIIASDLLVTPIVLETLAARELARGTLEIVERLREQVNNIMPQPFAKHVGFFVENRKTNVSQGVRETLLAEMEGENSFDLIDFTIRYRTAIGEAAALEIPIFDHKSKSTPEIKGWYDELIPQLLSGLEV